MPNDETGDVSKTVYVVGGIGAVGCVMMSLMMQHLLKVQGERGRSPVAIEVEQQCGTHLVGPIEVSAMERDGERLLVVRLRAKPGVECAPLARTIGDLIWRYAYKLPESPERLRLEVRSSDDQKVAPVVVESRPPGLGSWRTGKAPKKDAAPSPGSPASPPK